MGLSLRKCSILARKGKGGDQRVAGPSRRAPEVAMAGVEKIGAPTCRKAVFSLDFRAVVATLVSGEAELGPGAARRPLSV